jgi:hypothetical protein
MRRKRAREWAEMAPGCWASNSPGDGVTNSWASARESPATQLDGRDHFASDDHPTDDIFILALERPTPLFTL